MWLFWFVFLVAGLFGMWVGASSITLGLASRGWPKVRGRIESSEVETQCRQSHDSTSYAPSIAYSYKVGDTDYWGREISVGDHGGGRRRAERIVTKYPPGFAVDVFYDPDDPKTALLEPGFAPVPLWVFLMGAFFVTGAVLGFCGVIGGE